MQAHSQIIRIWIAYFVKPKIIGHVGQLILFENRLFYNFRCSDIILGEIELSLL